MRRMMRLFGLALAAAWLGGPGAGCAPAPPSNLSPTPDQATDRHRQAVRYTQDLAGRNQQAERKAMGRIGRQSPRR